MKKPNNIKDVYYDEKLGVVIFTRRDGTITTSLCQGEEFDIEKGILMNLIKDFGYSYSEVKRLVKKSKPLEELSQKQKSMWIEYDELKKGDVILATKAYRVCVSRTIYE